MDVLGDPHLSNNFFQQIDHVNASQFSQLAQQMQQEKNDDDKIR